MRFLRDLKIQSWIYFGIFNLLIVAIFGLLMRLKLIFPLPWVNQGQIMHAHSHFAFSGWVTHILMVMLLAVINQRGGQDRLSLKHQCLIIANAISAFGILISFTIQGYGLYSIIFSTFSVVVSYFFAIVAWKDLNHSAISPSIQIWFKAALVFLVLSSLGTYYLAYLKISKTFDAKQQLSAVYFYLHFQYNGWFLFSCLGFFIHEISKKIGNLLRSSKMFWVFFGCSTISYFLSLLWWNLPPWLYVLIVLAVILQALAWVLFIWQLRSRILQKGSNQKLAYSVLEKWFLRIVGAAFSLKLILQGLSVIPALSQWVYGFRPIVIAYLHLILLVMVSLFLLAYLYHKKLLPQHKWMVICLFSFAIAAIANEVLLAVQGVGALTSTPIKGIPHGLALVSTWMVVSLLLALVHDYKSPSHSENYVKADPRKV